MTGIAFTDWYNQNENSSYPVSLNASKLSGNGDLLPEDIICDLHIWFPRSSGMYGAISSVTVTDYIVSVTFTGTDYQPGDTLPPVPVFSPLGAVAISKPVELYKNYPISATVPGVGGWISFGKGIQTRTIDWRAADPVAGFLEAKISRSYDQIPFVDMYQDTNPYLRLQGIIRLKNGTGIQIEKDTRTVEGVEQDCIVINTDDTLTLDETRQLIGECAALAEQGECDPPLVRTINGVKGDADGNILVIAVPDEQGTIRTEDNSILIDSDIDLSDYCDNQDRLPDECGNLPIKRYDPCTEGRWNWCSSEVPGYGD